MEINVAKLNELPEGSYQLIDMRSDRDFEYGTIPGAIHILQEDLKENIFDEFVTRSDEKGDRQRGIGLGLAICKAVVNAHGGNICAENRKEGGARFRLWLEARQVSTDGR